MQGVVAGDCDEQGNADLCGGHKSRSCAHVDRDTTPALGIESSAIFEGKEFSPVALGVQAVKEALFGPTLMGKRILGGDEWQCNR